MCNLIVQIVVQYPFTLKKLPELILASFPHQNANLDSLVLYQRISHEIVDGLLRKVCKGARAEKNKTSLSSKNVSVS